MLDAARARKLLSYDPVTGFIRWRVRRPRREAGEVAGAINGTGYRSICIDSKLYPAHRIAWLLMTGAWPKHFIDHKNHDRTDNRWENLREATRSENQRNARAKRDTAVGLKGVHRTAHGGFRAAIWLNGRNEHLGIHGTAEAAHAAYRAAAVEHFGEFACVDGAPQ